MLKLYNPVLIDRILRLIATIGLGHQVALAGSPHEVTLIMKIFSGKDDELPVRTFMAPPVASLPIQESS